MIGDAALAGFLSAHGTPSNKAHLLGSLCVPPASQVLLFRVLDHRGYAKSGVALGYVGLTVH